MFKLSITREPCRRHGKNAEFAQGLSQSGCGAVGSGKSEVLADLRLDGTKHVGGTLTTVFTTLYAETLSMEDVYSTISCGLSTRAAETAS
jgi:hypothetical protein